MVLDCKVCGLEFSDQRKLIKHIKKLHTEYLSYEAYIIHFYFNNTHPACKCGCGIELKFESHTNPKFYSDYTKNHGPKKPIVYTEEEKKLLRAKQISGMMNKFGVENIMELSEFRDKIKNTKQIKYGDSTYNNPQKMIETNLKKYNVEYPQQNENIKQKSKITNLQLYNAPSFTATTRGKEAIKKTKLERYGDEKYINIEQIKKTKFERYGYETEFLNKNWRKLYNSINSKIERKVCADLNISKFEFNGYEFDGKYFKFLIEIDGDVWHSENLIHLTLPQLNSIQNDFRKTNLVLNSEFELIRVKANLLKKIDRVTFEDIWINAYEQDFNFDYYTIFTTKKYLLNLSRDKKEKYWRIFLRFIHTFQPEFPKILTKETFEIIVNKIQTYKIRPIEQNTFCNNTSNVGVLYLKSKFGSYWKSAYKNNPSPFLVWNDDKIMERLIKYRIGLNENDETFDFSLHQMIRGLSALRYTVSFFKPMLAASIYTHFLNDKQNPVVFDPCCGFGGRLLGFKAKFPNGTYIGCEPNVETFLELQELGKNFTNVYLYNCKIEDFDFNTLPDNLDLTFTSIPYYDLETYSNPVIYESFEHWQQTFLDKIKQCPNLVLNISNSLREHFTPDCQEYFISSNTSHFNKTENKKTEFLLDLRK